MSSETTDLADLVRTYNERVSGRDIDGVLELCADDITLIWPIDVSAGPPPRADEPPPTLFANETQATYDPTPPPESPPARHHPPAKHPSSRRPGQRPRAGPDPPQHDHHKRRPSRLTA